MLHLMNINKRMHIYLAHTLYLKTYTYIILPLREASSYASNTKKKLKNRLICLKHKEHRF